MVTADARELATAAADTMVRSLIQQDTKFGDDFAEHIRHFLDEGADQSLPEGVARAMIQEVRFLGNHSFPGVRSAGRPPFPMISWCPDVRPDFPRRTPSGPTDQLSSFPWIIYHTLLNLGFLFLSRAFHIWSWLAFSAVGRRRSSALGFGSCGWP